jgi:hypothetical protein
MNLTTVPIDDSFVPKEPEAARNTFYKFKGSKDMEHDII